MSQNIKNNLFRFVTLRSPQLIEDKDKQLGFVYYPDEESGSFYPPLNAASEGAKKQALLDARDNFGNSQSLFKTKADVKGLNEDLFKFSSWLMRNKNALSYAEILDNINNAQVISDENDLLKVWDNLIYQTLTKGSTYIREALIQLLVANKFLAHFNTFSAGLTEVITFTEDQEKEFVRCANASVVISKELLLETYGDKPVKTKYGLADTENQKRLSDLLTTKYDIAVLNNLSNELQKLKETYESQEKDNYKAALDTHNSAIKVILDNGSMQLVNKWDVETQANIQIEKFVHDPLPEFTYTKTVEIDPPALQAALSPLSYDYLENHELQTLTSYDAILKEVKHHSKLCANKKEQLMPKKGKSVFKAGATLRVEDPFKSVLTNFGDVDEHIKTLVERDVVYKASFDTEDFSKGPIDSGLPTTDYCLLVRSSIDRFGKSTIYMYLATPLGTEIIDASYSLTYEDNTNISYSGNQVNIVHGGPSSAHLGMLLFGSGLVLLDGEYELTGQFVLNNGKTLNFTLSDLLVQKGTSASAQTCAQVSDTEESPSTPRKLYGVTNLGIADFRRVEQEVCCYVPGEVSHIENVMAREYKERSTRSLTSSEFTTEQTDERERENLTDTTSTERNEMQSEVASVLNEDRSQSYGGNASVSGGKEPFRFQVGSYFDNASSSSSSNSNTQAQTYAQEVTERAMERIVQKTQTKRTSRILKEFEENNSHGFDNRKGTAHVTGVYRWVDKIYKNTLINYGKRLMYEFAIPEPSKFFQEAIWKTIEETGKAESGVILPEFPVHPSNLGLTSADVLADADSGTNKDYQRIAAIYNAEVSAIPKNEIVVGSSRSITTGDKNFQALSFDGEVEIPEGYKGVASAFSFNALEVGDSDDGVLASVGVGDIFINAYNQSGRVYIHNESEYPSASNFEQIPEEYTDFDGEFSGSVPYSASVNNAFTGNITVSVKCERTDEAFAQWQNDTYNAIMEAYYDRMREYNDAIREKEANEGLTPEAERLTFNPLQNQSIMLRELKRVAIELLIDKTRISKNNFDDTNDDTGVAEVIRDEAFQTHVSTVKFFEQAFDWDIMAYVFYPYFYAAEKDWKKLFQSQDVADPLFQAFLQSGMARTVVPVRPGFEDAVNWYMTTGEIWNGQGLVVDQEDDLYVSVAEEMQTVDGVIEGTWETRLPTALTILQAGSIGLNVEGLPCNDDCAKELFDTDKSPIEQTDTLIGGEEGPDGVGADFVSEPITVQ